MVPSSLTLHGRPAPKGTSGLKCALGQVLAGDVVPIRFGADWLDPAYDWQAWMFGGPYGRFMSFELV